MADTSSTVSMWAIHHADGSFEQVYADQLPEVPGADVFVLDRFGDLAVEYHDPTDGWTPRAAAARHKAIDDGYDIDHPMRRAVDYAIKQIEARLILSELTTTGLLAREAPLRGISIEDLARRVLVRADEKCPELGRIGAKLSEAREQDG